MKAIQINRQLLITVAATVFILWYLKACTRRGQAPPPAAPTVRIDTVYMPAKTDTFYKPRAVRILPGRIDTVLKKADTAAILADYLATRYYADTVAVKHGHVVIADTVQANQVQGRGVKLDLNLPVITRTVTLTAPRRALLYVGWENYGNLGNRFASGVSLGVKLKNEKYIGLKFLSVKNLKPLYGVESKIPIKL